MVQTSVPSGLPVRQAGRGLIGFIIALIVVVYAGMALKESFKVKNRYEEMHQFVVQLLAESVRTRQSEYDIQFAIVKKAKELGINLDKKLIEVTNVSDRLRIRFEWDDALIIPGFTYTKHYAIDESFKRFSR